MKNSSATCVWLTGVPCSGKSTIGRALSDTLKNEHGISSVYLDGDSVRSTVNSDLGFSSEDRTENIRRVVEIVKLLNKQGIFVISGFISPQKSMRENARKEIGAGFVEVFVHASISVCEARDVKGMYKKARNGTLGEFTGVSSLYEEPENADVFINTEDVSVESAVESIITHIKGK